MIKKLLFTTLLLTSVSHGSLTREDFANEEGWKKYQIKLHESKGFYDKWQQYQNNDAAVQRNFIGIFKPDYDGTHAYDRYLLPQSKSNVDRMHEAFKKIQDEKEQAQTHLRVAQGMIAQKDEEIHKYQILSNDSLKYIIKGKKQSLKKMIDKILLERMMAVDEDISLFRVKELTDHLKQNVKKIQELAFVNDAENVQRRALIKNVNRSFIYLNQNVLAGIGNPELLAAYDNFKTSFIKLGNSQLINENIRNVLYRPEQFGDMLRPLDTDPDMSVDGNLPLSAKKTLGMIWKSIEIAAEEQDRDDAKKSFAQGIAQCLEEDGHRVCPLGVRSRLIESIENYVLAEHKPHIKHMVFTTPLESLNLNKLNDDFVNLELYQAQNGQDVVRLLFDAHDQIDKLLKMSKPEYLSFINQQYIDEFKIRALDKIETSNKINLTEQEEEYFKEKYTLEMGLIINNQLRQWMEILN